MSGKDWLYPRFLFLINRWKINLFNEGKLKKLGESIILFLKFLRRVLKNISLRLTDRLEGQVIVSAILVVILIAGINFYLTRSRVSLPPATRPQPVDIRADELNLLARLVAAEAREEPYSGQVAVVAVVLNRLGNPAFPKTIPDIIFEPWAFESVANGHFWEVQPRYRDYAAVRDALNDWDPSNGATFFFNPDKATSAWIWTRPQIIKIGNHIFTS